jgi:NADH-quinone oxidoreductase subunit N
MTNITALDLTSILPELFLAAIAMAFLIIGVIRGNDSTIALCWATMVTFGATGGLLLGLDWERHEALNGLIVMDRFAGFLKLIILVGGVAVIALTTRYLQQEQLDRFEYPILVIFAVIGMMIMVSSNSFLSMYVGLELQSLCLYVLATFNRDHVKSAEAGLKYFILGALASGMLLFGISLIYGFTGSVNFHDIELTLTDLGAPVYGVTIGLVFILVGLAFKISAVPFHMWTPDVYQGAPTCVTALFAIIPKIAAIGLLIRIVFEPFGSVIWQWQQILWFLAFASMCWGSFAALVQNDIKRLMAYSTIGNVGYALVGVTAGSQAGASAAIIYMLIYMVMSAGAFGIILMMRRDNTAAVKISDLSGLSQNSPILAYAFAVILFSMAGIPPLAGFFGKFLIFEAAIAEGIYYLAIIGVLTSVVSAYYYLRIIKVMFFDEAADPFDKQMVLSKRVVVLLSVLFALTFITYPSTIVDAGRNAVAVLFFG